MNMKIGLRGTTYWPKELMERGWFNTMEIRGIGVTAIVIKPESSRNQIIESLELLLQELKLEAKAKIN